MYQSLTQNIEIATGRTVAYLNTHEVTVAEMQFIPSTVVTLVIVEGGLSQEVINAIPRTVHVVSFNPASISNSDNVMENFPAHLHLFLGGNHIRMPRTLTEQNLFTAQHPVTKHKIEREERAGKFMRLDKNRMET